MKQRKFLKSIISMIVAFALLLSYTPRSDVFAANMTISSNGLNIIKSFEGCRLTAYKATSAEQYYTIGWGHYGSDVYANMTITQEQADNMLISDLKRYEGYVNTFLSRYGISVNQNQFDALTSFTYNVGNVWVTSDFSLKTYLINGVNNYSADQIRTSFTNWNKQNGKAIAGLTRRRNMEADLFLSGTPAPSCDCSEAYAGNYIVSTSSLPLSLRSGHGTGYSIIAQIPKGSTVYVSKANGAWAHVEWNGYSGFCSMQYLTKVNNVEPPRMISWITDSVVPGQSMGDPIDDSQFKVGGTYYLCYELKKKGTEERFTADSNYTVDETIYGPNGNEIFSFGYEKSPYNWIRFTVGEGGTYVGKIKVSGDFEGECECRITAASVNGIATELWFSESRMGKKVESLNKGNTYYLCYKIFEKSSQKLLNQMAIQDYSVKLETKSPSGKSVTATYNRSDNNWIRFTASESGTYYGYETVSGDLNGSVEETAKCSMAVQGIALDHSILRMAVSDKETLKASITPANADNSSCSWVSSNSSVVSVRAGSVTALRKGVATITAKTSDGEKTASCVVVVGNKRAYYGDLNGDGKVNSSDLSYFQKLNSNNKNAGTDEQKYDRADVNADGKVDSSDQSLLQDYISGKALFFPAEGYGDLNGDGKITVMDYVSVNKIVRGIVTADEETKRRSDVNGDGKIDIEDRTLISKVMSGNIECFPVSEKPGVSSLNLSENKISLKEGEQKTITASIYPNDVGNKKVRWFSDNKNVATVDAGRITAVAAGTAKIKAIAVDGAVEQECEVTVKTKTPDAIKVTGVTLDKDELNMWTDERQALVATVLPSNATDKKVIWHSENGSVATVNQNGVVMACAPGETTIYVETLDGQLKATCTVTVKQKINPKSDTPQDDQKQTVKSDAKLIAGKVSGAAGDTVVVDVSIADNPGITSLRAAVKYDMNALTLTEVLPEDLFSSKVSGDRTLQSPYDISWYSSGSKDEKANGVLVRLKFRIKENASPGSYPIELSYQADNIVNSNIDNVAFSIENGSITVNSSMSGDLNKDHTINMKDIVLLQQYLNNWKVTIDESAADVNKDGTINMKDIVILQQYLNGWDVTLK